MLLEAGLARDHDPPICWCWFPFLFLFQFLLQLQFKVANAGFSAGF